MNAKTDGAIENAACHWPLCCAASIECAAHCLERDKLMSGEKGFLVECCIIPRADEKFFIFQGRSDGSIIANLYRYAIIPIEEYEELRGRSVAKQRITSKHQARSNR